MSKCHRLFVTKLVCEIVLSSRGDREKTKGKYVGESIRDESVILHFNKDNKIVSIELAGGDKPCTKVAGEIK